MNLFGTDGIRGKYGEELTKETAYALGSVLAQEQNKAIIVIGRDTRTSGSELLSALSKGVYDYGGQVLNMGIVPTNAVAHYVLKTGADFGVMISASHNPYYDNGLKVAHRGEANSQAKLTQEQVEEIKKTYKKNSKEYGSVALSKKYGVSHRTIFNVLQDKTYKQ